MKKLNKSDIDKADVLNVICNVETMPKETFLDRLIFATVKYSEFYGFMKDGKKVLYVTDKIYKKVI